jgi:hypothetical protein
MRLLHDKGINLGDLDYNQVDPAFQTIAPLIFDEKQLADLDKIDRPYGEIVSEIMIAVIAETFGSRGEEKNLSRSGDGRRTETG